MFNLTAGAAREMANKWTDKALRNLSKRVDELLGDIEDDIRDNATYGGLKIQFEPWNRYTVVNYREMEVVTQRLLDMGYQVEQVSGKYAPRLVISWQEVT